LKHLASTANAPWQSAYSGLPQLLPSRYVRNLDCSRK
jgi:hypothetical protein